MFHFFFMTSCLPQVINRIEIRVTGCDYEYLVARHKNLELMSVSFDIAVLSVNLKSHMLDCSLPRSFCVIWANAYPDESQTQAAEIAGSVCRACHREN